MIGIDCKEVIDLQMKQQKYTLSIDEAAAYFRIGRDKLYKIVSENKDADFILWNGTRAQIKRKKFENYIDKLNIL